MTTMRLSLTVCATTLLVAITGCATNEGALRASTPSPQNGSESVASQLTASSIEQSSPAMLTPSSMDLPLAPLRSLTPLPSPTPSSKSSAPGQGSGLTEMTPEDWEQSIRDIDCKPIDMGTEFIDVTFADVRGGGVQDAFVTVDCVHGASTWPHQLEVFDGTSPVENPRQIGLLLDAEQDLFVSAIDFAGPVVTLELVGYTMTDPRCCPSKSLTKEFTWTGKEFQETTE